jgi:type II secretory pathway pseudopilin PulG
MYQDGTALPARARGRWPHGTGSFTLVEVVISIAVTSFILISILGLMAYASRVVQQSDNNARLSMVLSQTLSILGTESYMTGKTQVGTNIAYYYTWEGVPTNSSGAYYQCNVTNATPTGFSLNDTDKFPFMEPVQIIIRWPYNGTGHFANTNTIVTSINSYD